MWYGAFDIGTPFQRFTGKTSSIASRSTFRPSSFDKGTLTRVALTCVSVLHLGLVIAFTTPIRGARQTLHFDL